MPQLSVVIPVRNEERNIPRVFVAVSEVMAALPDIGWSLLFVDDGSTDDSFAAIQELAKAHEQVQFIELSRNFGKEIATTAGLAHASGDAVIMMDADLQHPPSYIPKFIEAWQGGADMVIGVRRKNTHEKPVKRIGSYFFNRIMALASETSLVTRETDFRLISHQILDEYRRFTEKGRMTRALLNWLGFRCVYIEFDADARTEGEPSYRTRKLVRLALSYFLSHTQLLLNIPGVFGFLALFISVPLGIFIIIDKYILHDPWGFNFSGSALLATLNIILTGVMLLCVWLVALHIGSIHQEAMNRPLFVVRSKKVKK